RGCGHCALCRAGLGNVCPDRTLIGVHVPGAFADYVRVPGADARVLPDGVSARLGALMEPPANGVHAVRLAGGAVPPAVPLAAGPEQFARLAEGPPAEFKVFLAGTGRES